MPGPPPVIARARTAVRASLTARLEDLADRTDAAALRARILIGLSGGADSLALMATTTWVASRMGLAAEAAIIDHGLTEDPEDSARVAARAAEAATRLGAAEVHIRRVHVDRDTPGGLENAARDARRAALSDLLEERQGLAILLGHTLDDQAEQVLMGLARGAGPRAVAGIAPARGAWLRPFLGTGRDPATALRRRDTEEICALHDLEPWQDPMNQDLDLLRVRVRRTVLPLLEEALGEQIGPNLARTAGLVRADVDHLDAAAQDLLEALRRDHSPRREEGDLLLVDAHALAAEPEPLRTRVLRDAARLAEQLGAAPSSKSLVHSQVVAMDQIVVAWRGQGPIALPGRIELARRDGLLIWRRSRTT